LKCCVHQRASTRSQPRNRGTLQNFGGFCGGPLGDDNGPFWSEREVIPTLASRCLRLRRVHLSGLSTRSSLPISLRTCARRHPVNMCPSLPYCASSSTMSVVETSAGASRQQSGVGNNEPQTICSRRARSPMCSYARPSPRSTPSPRSRFGSPRISPSIIGMAGNRARQTAKRPNDRAAIGLPASAALTVGGLIPASRARSAADQPRRASSMRSRPG
jgi:hypothetical protein